MSHETRDTSPTNRSKSFFVRQLDGSLRCPTCAKARVDCLQWNEDEQVFEYRLRKPSTGEVITTATHGEIGPIRIVTRWAVHHGLRYEVLAELTVCAAGVMIITDWTSSAIRAYGSRIPGRMGFGRRRAKSATGRRNPLPLRFSVQKVYDWVLRFLVSIPRDPEEFVRLMVICSRLIERGVYQRGLLVEYADDLCRHFGYIPPVENEDQP